MGQCCLRPTPWCWHGLERVLEGWCQTHPEFGVDVVVVVVVEAGTWTGLDCCQGDVFQRCSGDPPRRQVAQLHSGSWVDSAGSNSGDGYDARGHEVVLSSSQFLLGLGSRPGQVLFPSFPSVFL